MSIEFEVVPRQRYEAGEGYEAGWSWPYLKATGPGISGTGLICPMFDTSDETVALAKNLILKSLDGDDG